MPLLNTSVKLLLFVVKQARDEGSRQGGLVGSNWSLEILPTTFGMSRTGLPSVGTSALFMNQSQLMRPKIQTVNQGPLHDFYANHETKFNISHIALQMSLRQPLQCGTSVLHVRDTEIKLLDGLMSQQPYVLNTCGR